MGKNNSQKLLEMTKVLLMADIYHSMQQIIFFAEL